MKLSERLIWVWKMWWNFAAAEIQYRLRKWGVLGSVWRTRTEFSRCLFGTVALLKNRKIETLFWSPDPRSEMAWREIERQVYPEYLCVTFDTLVIWNDQYYVLRRKT